MGRYRLSRHRNGFRVDADTDPPRIVALIERRLDRRGDSLGWRLRPATILSGPHSRVWISPEAALAGFGLMTKAQARAAVAALAKPAG